MPFITIEGENKIAQQQGNSQLLDISHFVLANITGLGAEPVDRIETLPVPGDIVDTRPVSRAGYVNTNQVVYSVSLDSTIGDYTFNWVGIKDIDDVLIAVAYLAAPITKTATNGGIDGNNLVRNFLLQYSGIQATTAISAPASTWQIDFTTRLLQIDERERLSNFDIYGHEEFLSGFVVTPAGGSNYDVSAGIGYVGGVRAELTADQTVAVSPLPSAIWVDASLQGDINGVSEVISFTDTASVLTDYTDGNGFEHFVTKICDISSGGVITDTRVVTEQYVRVDDTPSQAEAEAGISTTVRAWSALRVKQAILALVKNASQTVKGIAEIATQNETDAGTDDLRFVTPKKLRFGFLALFAANGYVIFPTWMASFIFQWGGSTIVDKDLITFNTPFPNNCYFALASDGTNSVSPITSVVAVGVAHNQFTTSNFMVRAAAGSFALWFAIGR